MRGTIPPLPQYDSMAWCSVKAQGQLYLHVLLSFKMPLHFTDKDTYSLLSLCWGIPNIYKWFIICVHKFFSYCLFYGPVYFTVYFMWNFFVLSSRYFEKVFVCGFVILFLFSCCCIYLYVFLSSSLIPHPIVAITSLSSHEMYVCMYVCMYVYLCMYMYVCVCMYLCVTILSRLRPGTYTCL
jgi:nuclear pore complex protein Nup62